MKNERRSRPQTSGTILIKLLSLILIINCGGATILPRTHAYIKYIFLSQILLILFDSSFRHPYQLPISNSIHRAALNTNYLSSCYNLQIVLRNGLWTIRSDHWKWDIINTSWSSAVGGGQCVGATLYDKNGIMRL